MPIYSGSHELYGKFSLRRRSADVLAEWLATQSYENDFDKRDARLWIERIAVTDDNEIELFESTRSSYRDVGQRIEFLGWLADQAENGQAFVQHVENGFQLTRFVVNRGQVQPILRLVVDNTRTSQPGLGPDETRRSA